MYSKNDICILTVTYGNRLKLLSKMIESVINAGIYKIVVVENGVDPDSITDLTYICNSNGIKLITLGTNSGSAGGFCSAIEYFYAHCTAEFAWILDDDNIIDIKSADSMLERLNSSKGNEVFRSIRGKSVDDYLNYGTANIYSPARSSVFEFSIIDLPVKIGRKYLNMKSAELVVPYSPYGGLMLSKKAISVIGFPDRNFFLYMDDIEYTYRLTAAGWKIISVDTSHVIDLEPYWGNSGLLSTFTRFLSTGMDRRIYYTTRNHYYFDRKFWSRNMLVFELNKWIFVLIVKILSIILRRENMYKLFRKGMRDGEVWFRTGAVMDSFK